MSTESPSRQSFKRSESPEVYMRRCFQLAVLGSGFTAPNPMVGAVLVHEGKIIGEGYHQKFGEAHAEVNCVRSVRPADRHLISRSTLYVSLEPCNHFGKTPPCSDLILHEKIPDVVIGCRDPFPTREGKGIEKLSRHHVNIQFPVLEEEAIHLNRRFFCFHQRKRPYIVLKWAQSSNQKIAGEKGERIAISNAISNRLVHKWRTEEAGILVGTNTALLDNPELTARLWPGKNPVRIVVDRRLRLPDSLKLFDLKTHSMVLNELTDLQAGNLHFKKIQGESKNLESVLTGLYEANILSVMVEGGRALLQSFFDAGIWDEARIITNHVLEIQGGVSSPNLFHAKPARTEIYDSDTIQYFVNLNA